MPLTGPLSELFRNLLIIFQGSGSGMYFFPIVEDSLPICAVIAVWLLVISCVSVSPPLPSSIFISCILHSTHLLLIHATYRCCGYRGRYNRHCPQHETEMLFGIPSGQSFVAAVSIDTQAIVVTVTSCNSFGHGHTVRLDMQCPVSGHAIRLEPHCTLYL